MEIGLLLLASLVSYSPLLLILLFILYLILMILYLVFIMNSYFYSYLMFLLFISGLVIMFMYLCSIILNEKLSISTLLMFYLLGLSLTFFNTFFIETLYGLSFNLVFYEFYNLAKFFIYSYNLFSSFFILYLFFCLMIVYEFIKNQKGPLRSTI